MARTAVIQDVPSQTDQPTHSKAVATDRVSQSIHQSVNSPSTHREVYLTPDEKAARVRERQLLQKARRQEHYFSLVFAAAYVTIMVLGKHGLSCAVFGSLACKLYGSFRYPEDVDILVLQQTDRPRTAEQLKKLIVNTDPQNFYFKLPRDTKAPYRKLYYRGNSEDGCKVDILTPGTMSLPDLCQNSSRNHITTIHCIPLVPFSLLLLHKLQGWHDHFHADDEYQRRKRIQDGLDVQRLLKMTERISELQETRPWGDEELFCEALQKKSKERVREFCKTYPKTVETWQSLGFETS